MSVLFCVCVCVVGGIDSLFVLFELWSLLPYLLYYAYFSLFVIISKHKCARLILSQKKYSVNMISWCSSRQLQPILHPMVTDLQKQQMMTCQVWWLVLITWSFLLILPRLARYCIALLIIWSHVSKHLWVLIFDVQFETGNYVQEANVCNQWRPGILWLIMSFLD